MKKSTLLVLLLAFASGVFVGVKFTGKDKASIAAEEALGEKLETAPATTKQKVVAAAVAPTVVEVQLPRSSGALVESHAPQLQAQPNLPAIVEPAAAGETAWTTPVTKWQNVGRATVGAAIQSQYWAISRGEMEYLSSSIVIDQGAKTSFEMLLEQVPTDVREKYPTRESLAAFFIASIPALERIAIGRAIDDSSVPGDITVTMHTLEPKAEKFGGATQRFRRSNDGEWFRVVQSSDINRWARMVKTDKELSKSRTWPGLK